MRNEKIGQKKHRKVSDKQKREKKERRRIGKFSKKIDFDLKFHQYVEVCR